MDTKYICTQMAQLHGLFDLILQLSTFVLSDTQKNLHNT